MAVVGLYFYGAQLGSQLVSGPIQTIITAGILLPGLLF